MAVATREHGGGLRPAMPATVDVVQPVRVQPVKIWATAGALVLAFIAYVLISWVTGPYFERVPQGPSEPGTAMKIGLEFFQWASIPAALGFIWWFFVRPLRRDGHVGVDGLLVIAFATLWFQDPLSSWTQPWFQYNSYLINYGSWLNDVPGASLFGQPGAMLHEPILFIPGAYVYACLLATIWGCWCMRKARARWPRMPGVGLVGVCLLSVVAFDVVLEGIIWLPVGVFEYGGGHWAILRPDSYSKYPLQEALTFGMTFSATACLRYWVNDRGRTIVERGAEELRGSRAKIIGIRVLAMVAAVHLAMFCFYTIPNTLMSTNQPSWPVDLQKRSYLMGGLCGDGTDRACPGPDTPIIRNGGAYISPDGKAVFPDGAKPTGVVPFDRGKPGPEGP